MEKRMARSSALVGLFVLTAAALLLVGTLWISGSTAVVGPRVGYTVLLGDSGGVEPGDRVRIAGVTVGRIRQVVLAPDPVWPVRLAIALKPDVTLHADATATISSQGMLGDSFLQILPGSVDAPRLEPGSEIPGTPPMDLARAMARVDEITGKLSTLLDHVSGLVSGVSGQVDGLMGQASALLSEENTENLRVTLATLRGTMEESGPRLTALLERLDGTVSGLDGAVAGLPELTERASSLMARLETAMGPDGNRLAGVLDAAREGLMSADEAVTLLTANRAEIDATLSDLRDTVANLKAFSQQVRERPHSLVRVSNPADRKPGDGVEEARR